MVAWKCGPPQNFMFALQGLHLDLEVDQDVFSHPSSPRLDRRESKKANQKLALDESKEAAGKRAKQVYNDLASKVGQVKENVKDQSKQAKDTAETNAKPYAEAAKEKTNDVKDGIKKEADHLEQSSQKSNNLSEKPNGTAEDQSAGWECRTEDLPFVC